MKKFFLLTLFALLAWGGNAFAQKVDVEIQQQQSRLVEVFSRAYVKPVTVELKVLQTQVTSKSNNQSDANGRISETYHLTKDEVEVSMGGQLGNVRAWAVYKAAEDYNVDAIVAATFNFRSNPENNNEYLITITGYVANFVNWKTATEADYEWIRMEKVMTTDDREKMSAIVRK